MAVSLTRKRVVLLLSLVATFITGVTVPLALMVEGAELRIWNVVISFVVAILVASWCQEDSRPRSIRVGKPLLWLIVLLAPLGLLVYLFRSRSPSRAMLSILLCCGFGVIILGFLDAGAMAGVLIGDAIVEAQNS